MKIKNCPTLNITIYYCIVSKKIYIEVILGTKEIYAKEVYPLMEFYPLKGEKETDPLKCNLLLHSHVFPLFQK